MPPTKRTTGTTAAATRRSKRFRPLVPATDLEEARPSALNAPPEEAGAGTMRVNVQALTSTIATAVSQAVKEALAAQLPGRVPLLRQLKAWLIIRKRPPAKILSNLYSLLIKVLTRLKEIHCINCLTSLSTRQSFQVSRDISRLMTSHNVFLQMGNIYTPKF